MEWFLAVSACNRVFYFSRTARLSILINPWMLHKIPPLVKRDFQRKTRTKTHVDLLLLIAHLLNGSISMPFLKQTTNDKVNLLEINVKAVKNDKNTNNVSCIPSCFRSRFTRSCVYG